MRAARKHKKGTKQKNRLWEKTKMIKKLFLFGFLAVSSTVASATFFRGVTYAAPTDDFVFSVKTDNAGTSNSTSFTIPTTGAGYNYSVDWNDDTVIDSTGIAGNTTHDYGVAGTYTIRISGTFPRIFFNNSGDKLKITNISQWGTGAWSNMQSAFSGASNMTVTATDVPNFGAVTSMSGMFQGASLANPITTGWDTSNVTNMSLMFSDAVSANPNTSNWDVSQVTSMAYMFMSAANANPDVSNWDVSHVVDMQRMFTNATSATPITTNWVTTSLTSTYVMFGGATAANPNTTNWDMSHVASIGAMFSGATNANPNVSNWNLASLTEMYAVFQNATSAKPDVSNWNTSNVTNMWAVFEAVNHPGLDVSNWDMSLVTNIDWMFVNAHVNPNVSNWNLASLTNMNYAFQNTVGANPNVSSWNTSNVTLMEGTFKDAADANPDVSSWNVAKVTTMKDMFVGSKLTMQNYDKLLNAWKNQALKSNVLLGAGTTKYCGAAASRATIVSTFTWTITDGGQCGVAPTVTDTDGDGIDNSTEGSVAPNGDGNGDSQPDNTQITVASVSNGVTGKHTTLEIPNGCVAISKFDVVAENKLSTQDTKYIYPVGLQDFTLQCANFGDSATVKVYYDKQYDTSKWQFRKFNTNTGIFTDISSLITYGVATVNGQSVTTATYTVLDGGSNDDDGVANGIIIDPAGPAVLDAQSAAANSNLDNTGIGSLWSTVAGLSLVVAAGFLAKIAKKSRIYKVYYR